MTDVLVLGGAGSVGAVCVIQLVKKGFSVVVVDHSEIGLFQLEKKLAELEKKSQSKVIVEDEASKRLAEEEKQR